MALRDTIQIIQKEQEGLKATSTGVEEARRLYSELSRQITNAKARLRRKKSSEHVDVIVRDIIRELRRGRNLEYILSKEIDEALIASSSEFEQYADFYKPLLKKVAKDKNIYKLIPVGSGWSTKLSPQIVFEEEAGNTSDYVHGILSYRLELIEEERMSPVGKQGSGKGLKATTYWKKNIYGGERYEETVEGRIRLSNRPAPFWQLIAKGSTGMKPTRPDGTYNPFPSKGYDFVEFSETKIKSLFNTELAAQKALWSEEVRLFEEEVKRAADFKQEFDTGIKKISTNYNQNRLIFDSFGAKKRYIDEDKLAQAAEKLRAGDETRGRINIGIPGKRVYLTLQHLEGYD